MDVVHLKLETEIPGLRCVFNEGEELKFSYTSPSSVVVSFKQREPYDRNRPAGTGNGVCSAVTQLHIERPGAVVVSAHGSARDRNPAFLLVITAKVFRRSRAERASRSNRHHHRVADGDFGEKPAKLRPVGLRSTCRTLADLMSTRTGKRELSLI
jgi:hypothetical protein